MPVTRVEIVDHVEGAFFGEPVGREALIAEALHTSGRATVVSILRTLPDRSYSQVRDLWSDLRDIPIGVDDAS